ncbi:MAG: CHAT domain-containing protein [Actinomycetota bacterium]|nr:CHAT domain-containing protein [Actinomycetota bacterium]
MTDPVEILVRVRGAGPGPLAEATGAGVAGRYRVEAELDDGSRYENPEAIADLARLRAAALDPEAYGRRLFESLFSGRIAAAYERAVGRAGPSGMVRVLLWIDDDLTEVHALRWERLRHLRNGALVPLAASVQTPFARFVPVEAVPPPPVPTRPIRILVAVSNPANLPPGLNPIDVEREVEGVTAALGDLRTRAEISVTILPGRTGLSPDLSRELATQGYEIAAGPTTRDELWRRLPGHHALHLLAHGRFRSNGGGSPGQSALFLERADGSVDAATDAELVAKLATAHPLPHLVFLAACESASGAEGIHPFLALGPKLVRAGVPAVVAMQGVVAVEVARAMTHDFYAALSDHGVIDVALNQARQVAFARKETTWSSPALFTRMRRGVLFVPRNHANRVSTEAGTIEPGGVHGAVLQEDTESPKLRRRGRAVLLPRRPRVPLDRAGEMEAARQLIGSGRSVELVGPNGSGKTLLLKHLVHELGSLPADGVVHVGGRGRGANDLLSYLFDALVETDRNYLPNEAERRRHLQDSRVLFAVDDAELPREEIEALLDGAPRATFLLAASERNAWEDVEVVSLPSLPVADCVTLFEEELRRSCDAPQRRLIEDLAVALEGNPLRVLQLAALVRDEGLPLEDALAHVRYLGAAAAPYVGLSDEDRVALAVVAAAGGDGVHVARIADASGVEHAAPVVEHLERRHLLRAGSPWYSVTDPESAAKSHPELFHEQVLTSFARWTRAHAGDPGLVLQHADALLGLLRRTPVADERYDAIAGPLEDALIVGRRWDAWRELLQRQAGWGHAPSEARVLHQLGAHAYGQGDYAGAVGRFATALRMRLEVDDEEGAALTRHNLEVAEHALEPTPQKRSRGRRRRPGRRLPPWTGALVLVLVAAGLAGTGVRLFYAADEEAPTPSAVPTDAQQTSRALGGVATRKSPVDERPNVIVGDLVLHEGDITDAGAYVAPVTTSVTNTGTTDAGAFKVAFEYVHVATASPETASPPASPSLVPFSVPSEAELAPSPLSFAFVRGLGAGETIPITGYLRFPGELRGAHVSVTAVADSCAAEDIPDPPCRIDEASDEDNRSRPQSLLIPPRDQIN